MKEGDEVGMDCPKCDTPMIFDISCYDIFEPKYGHDIREIPIIVCPKCDYYEVEPCEE